MSDRPLVRRRTAVGAMVGGILAASLLGACEVDDLRPPEADESPTPTSPPGQPTPDEALVDEALTSLVAALDLLASARAFGSLKQLLGPLARAHEAHVEALGVVGEVGTLSDTPRTAAEALRRVRSGERHLHGRLVDGAVRAESGALARLLASMAASVSQHLAVLPASVPAGAGR